MRLRSYVFAGAVIALLGACATEDLSAPPPPIGDFDLGFNIVVARDPQQVGPSRTATPAEWEAVMKAEIEKRIGRYNGNKLYHLGVNVDGYALAYPGIPVLLNPKSVLVVSVNVWDDTAQRRINAEPKQITVFEPFSGETLIGSGLTQTKETQMQNLAANAARKINDWLAENKAWFTPEAVAARAAMPKTPVAPGVVVPRTTAPAATPAAQAATAPAAPAAPATPARPAPAAQAPAAGAPAPKVPAGGRAVYPVTPEI
jgi:hypothetical protein